MAVLNNTDSQENSKREYATDVAGMMADAKKYARTEMSTVIAVLSKLGLEAVNDTENDSVKDGMKAIPLEAVAKSVIAVKYEQIKKARTDRPAWEKYLD